MHASPQFLLQGPAAWLAASGASSWTLPLLRGAHERTGPKLVSRSGGPPVVEDPATPRSAAPRAVSPHAAIHPTLVSRSSYLSSLSATALERCHPRWEPDALVAPVRICGGGREQSRSLLRPDRRPSMTVYSGRGVDIVMQSSQVPVGTFPVSSPERSRCRGRRFACDAPHVMPQGRAVNCDFRFSPIFLSHAKSIGCRRKKIQFP